MSIPVGPAPSTRFTVSVRDHEGRDRIMAWHAVYSDAAGNAASAGDAAAVAILENVGTALVNLSNAQFIKGTISQEYGFGAAIGGNSQYNSNRQKAVLHFSNTVSGDAIIFEIPAPKNANFLGADDETVDPAAVSALVTALDANSTSTRDGTPATGAGWVYVRGYLVEKHTSKALSPGFATELGGE